jgi:hypothetical protein
MPEPHHDPLCSAGYCIHKAPEARVDWELEVRKILSRFLKRASDPSYDEKHQFDVAIRDLSAAFEKGRGAR